VFSHQPDRPHRLIVEKPSAARAAFQVSQFADLDPIGEAKGLHDVL
jgi:hypothetical protein